MNITGGNENTYNPSCPHFYEHGGYCKHDETKYFSCRARTCPLNPDSWSTLLRTCPDLKEGCCDNPANYEHVCSVSDCPRMKL